MKDKPQTLNEAIKDLREACLDFAFEFGYMIGVIWIVNRIPQLKLKPWAQARLDKKLNNGE